MVSHNLSEAEAEAVRSALLNWQLEGIANPTIPVYGDLDGDGVPDFYGLSALGELVIVSGATVAGPVAESTGAEGF